MRGLSKFTSLIIILVIITSIMVGYSLLSYRTGGKKVINIATLHGGISSIDIIRYLGLDAKYGLELNIVYFEKTLDIKNALMKGDIDMAIIPLEVVGKIVEDEGEVYIIAADMYQNQKLILGKDLTITSPMDLKTIKIGVFTPTGTYVMFKAYMNLLYGFTEDDLKIVNLPPNLMVHDILKGDVDMIVIWEPLASIAISKGCKIYMSFQELWKNATGFEKKPIMIVYAANKNFVDSNKDAIERFLEAREEAAKAWNNDFEVAKGVLLKYYDIGEDVARILYEGLEFYPYKYIDKGDFTVIKQVLEIAYKGGYLEEDLGDRVISLIYGH